MDSVGWYTKHNILGKREGRGWTDEKISGNIIYKT